MTSVTLISDLQHREYSVNIDHNHKNLHELVVDLSIPLVDRINCIELFFDKFGQEESNEIVNRLSTMYQFSGTKILEQYLYEICTNCKISSFLKITAVKQ